eukprot:768600-Hanusia_phi.AAC.8
MAGGGCESSRQVVILLMSNYRALPAVLFLSSCLIALVGVARYLRCSVRFYLTSPSPPPSST